MPRVSSSVLDAVVFLVPVPEVVLSVRVLPPRSSNHMSDTVRPIRPYRSVRIPAVSRAWADRLGAHDSPLSCESVSKSAQPSFEVRTHLSVIAG